MTGRGSLLYVDSSALTKLVLPDEESATVLKTLAAWESRVSSTLLIPEVVRSSLRTDDTPETLHRAQRLIATVTLIPMDATVLWQAAELGPRLLRSLDAIHLATALSIADDLGGFLTYDARLADAAGAAGLPLV